MDEDARTRGKKREPTQNEKAQQRIEQLRKTLELYTTLEAQLPGMNSAIAESVLKGIKVTDSREIEAIVKQREQAFDQAVQHYEDMPSADEDDANKYAEGIENRQMAMKVARVDLELAQKGAEVITALKKKAGIEE